VDQPVEDRVDKRGVADHFMPVVGRELAGDQGGPAADAVFHLLQEIPTFPIADGGTAAGAL
jgi:hypothetical protein